MVGIYIVLQLFKVTDGKSLKIIRIWLGINKVFFKDHDNLLIIMIFDSNRNEFSQTNGKFLTIICGIDKKSHCI